MAEEMFDGFDQRKHKEEVTQRWGQEAYESSAQWWESLRPDDKQSWKATVDQLSQDWANAAAAGVGPESDRCQDLARRHVQWLRAVLGTPANEPGTEGAQLVRDSLNHYLEANADH